MEISETIKDTASVKSGKSCKIRSVKLRILFFCKIPQITRNEQKKIQKPIFKTFYIS